MGFLGLRRVRVVLLAGVLTVGVMGVVVAGAGASPTRAARGSSQLFAGGRAGFSPTARELAASALRTPHATRSLAPTKVGAKVPWLSRADSNTFVAGSGHLMAKIYPFPVNYRLSSSGAWTPINTALKASSSGYAQTSNDLGVRVPKSAAALARVADRAGGLSFGLVGASGVGRVAGTTEMFPHARPGVDLAYSSQSSGIGWQAQLSPAAASRGLTWTVRASKGLSAGLVSGGVAFRTAQGKVAWVFAAPTARQAGSGKPVATRLSLAHSAHGTVIHVAAAPPRATRSPAVFSPSVAPSVVPAAVVTSRPIVWSGQVVPGSVASLGAYQQTGDCYIDATSPDTSLCGGDTDYVGPGDHMLLNFDVADNLPSHVQVLQSFVGVGLTSASTTTAENVGVWQAAEPWTNLASWNSYDGTNPWTTPGGDTTGQMDDYDPIGASSDVGNYFYWNITPTMQGWVDGNPSQVDGLLFAPTAGSGASNTLGFASETTTADNGPYITVAYEPRMGDYPGAKYDSQQLTDRSSEGVNVATGNLLVSNTDLNLSGVNGLNVQVGRSYNNLSGDQGAFGVGWSMGTGADTYLEVPSDGQGTVDYFDGTGNAQTFQLTPTSGTTEVSPPGEDAQLTMNNPGDTYDSSTFTLLFRHSGITETFTAPAGQFNKLARLSSLSDRNGNTIHYDYNSSGQLTSIVDSHSKTTTIAYSPEGYVSQITDPTGRTYKYTQNSAGQLTSYEDPAGNSTTYSYDSYGNLTQITTPGGNITNVGYDAGNTNEVTSVQRLVNPTDSSGPETTYQTGPAGGFCPNSAGWSSDTVSDPDRHTTTYCTDDLSRLTQVIDANGNMRSTSYTPDGFVKQLMTPSGVPTAFSYAGNGSDNVTQIQQGASGGSGPSPLTTSLSYGDQANPYLATQATDPQNHSMDATYNSSGNLTQTKQPTTGVQATLTYNSDGTVATSTDPDGHVTTYSYAGGNLTTVTPPTGSGLNAIHLSYDAANRVSEISTVSGSTGHEVEYSYDSFDRITQAVYKNAAGSTVATLGYHYDKDGNLLSRDDSAGTTSYTYDGLDRLTHVDYPANGGYDSYDYDAASNLVGLTTDPGGTVSYGYDKANQLISVADPGQSKPAAALAYTTDGLLHSTTYASGASVVNAYNALDQLQKVTDTYKTSTGAAGHLSYAYSYTGDLQNTVTDQAGNTTTYSYDALNRLTDAKTQNSGGTTTAEDAYTLDPAGNILQQAASGSAGPSSTTSYAYNPANEICWSYTGSSTAACGSPPAGAHAYSYDPDGNQTSNGNGLTATYNALGQTTSMTSNGTTTNYSYLGQGQGELVGQGSTSLQNDQLGLASQTTSSGNSTYYTRSLDGSQIDERTPTGTYNYLYDGQGNVIGLTDSTGHLLNQYAYDPYGNKTTNTGTAPNPFGFQDGYTTPTGPIHFGARYLNPNQGSWTQQDPLNQITDLTQADRYVYASGDPIDLSDPSGKDIFGDIALGVDTLVSAAETIGFSGVGALATASCIAATGGALTIVCAAPALGALTSFFGGALLTYKEGSEFYYRVSHRGVSTGGLQGNDPSRTGR